MCQSTALNTLKLFLLLDMLAGVVQIAVVRAAPGQRIFVDSCGLTLLAGLARCEFLHLAVCEGKVRTGSAGLARRF
jgi:hypothetical protein